MVSQSLLASIKWLLNHYMASIKWFLNHYMASIKWFLNHYMASIKWFLNHLMASIKWFLDQFFYGGNEVVPDDVMEAIRDEIHDETNILYNYTIPLTIPILECILKRNKMMKYKNSIYFIYFKLSGVPFPCNTMKEYNSIINAFNVVSTIYDKYKPKGRKSFLNYYFTLKKILIVLGKNDYAKYIPPLKTNLKQKELERIWELITKDPEWIAALQKRKIV